MQSPEDRTPDEEKGFLSLPPEDTEPAILSSPSPPSKETTWRLFFAMAANTLATIGIVFTNKQFFNILPHEQVTFAAFHFFVTFSILWLSSFPRIGLLTAKRAPFLSILPLATAMCLNVILPNLSLAYSSITFYQIVRVLLTPCVAVLNFFILRKTVPFHAALALIPVCIGVGIVTYFDSLPAPGQKSTNTTFWGVVFAFVGVFCSSVYTVWIKKYHDVLEMNSMQLLLNQAPVSVFLLLYVIPFSDDITVWPAVEGRTWILIGMSGIFAAVINLSQFIIVNDAGPVSSTVVGHLKTCCIVALGWMFSGRDLRDWSLVGIILALGGIFTYTWVMQRKPPA